MALPKKNSRAFCVRSDSLQELSTMGFAECACAARALFSLFAQIH